MGRDALWPRPRLGIPPDRLRYEGKPDHMSQLGPGTWI
eukprot:CAMPEP_0174372240 /NCGR_PEP_ID=MMETSP0811_2-20130205/102875_1 /TAXON_ID=73025 ORGANISM="Eutreptiella gymnastica-like, Strain CCMP1594" /NCGR_SAMPLE_ID=MMETSP0811_2 /ASSEMBLY_ACC=CAM_ASM_000667 /LENGTH=37 /DNA_ID= /DNA_START= /DNA_END= /DNA_ORIENTATION=